MAKRPTHAEQLAAFKRPDELTRLNGEVARLKEKLRETELERDLRVNDLDNARECLSLVGGGGVLDDDLWASMKRQRDDAAAALRALYDAQNGPTLPERHEAWRAAYEQAGTLLRELEPESEASDASDKR